MNKHNAANLSGPEPCKNALSELLREGVQLPIQEAEMAELGQYEGSSLEDGRASVMATEVVGRTHVTG